MDILFEGAPVLVRKANREMDAWGLSQLLEQMKLGHRAPVQSAVEETLEKRPQFSFVAEVARERNAYEVLGMALADHDTRCGWLHSAWVEPKARGLGIGSLLVGRCLEALARAGITRTHAEILPGEDPEKRLLAAALRRGWEARAGTPFLGVEGKNRDARKWAAKQMQKMLPPLPPGVTIAVMRLEHIAQALDLWQRCPGVPLRPDKDSAQAIEELLRQNAGLSRVALHQEKVIGTSLGAKYLDQGTRYHWAVDPKHRGRGIGAHLAVEVTQALLQHNCRRVMSQSLDHKNIQRLVDLGFEVVNRASGGSTIISTRTEADLGFTLAQPIHPSVAHPPKPRCMRGSDVNGP